MKRLLFLVVVMVMLLGTLSACVDQNEASKFCKAHDDFGVKHGECVSQFTSASSIAEWCQENWEEGYLGAEFKNQGDCVSTINSWDLLVNP